MERDSCVASSAAFAGTKRTKATKMKTAAFVALVTTRFTALRRRGRGRIPRIIRQRTSVLRALKYSWIRAISLAHDAFDLLDRFVFVFLQPFEHFAFDHPNMINAVPQ